MRVVGRNRRFRSKGPFRRRSGIIRFSGDITPRVQSPKEDDFKIPSTTFVPRRYFPIVRCAERFTQDDLILSTANPDMIRVEKLYNPSIIFASPPSKPVPAPKLPILESILNTDPSPCPPTQKMYPSAALGLDPSSVTKPTEISPSFSGFYPFPSMDPPSTNLPNLATRAPYPPSSGNFPNQGRGLSPFNKWFRIIYITGDPYSECANYLNR